MAVLRERIMMVLLVSGCELGDAQNSHQPRGLMIGDVTMQHPVAGIVGDEGDFDLFLGRHQHGVTPLMVWNSGAVAAEHAKAVTVQMHRMPPRGVVAKREQRASTASKC